MKTDICYRHHINCNGTTCTLFRGTIARVAIQCDAGNGGLIGSFLFTGDTHREPTVRVSPTFTDLMKLYKWTRANGWRSVGDAYVYEP